MTAKNKKTNNTFHKYTAEQKPTVRLYMRTQSNRLSFYRAMPTNDYLLV